MSRNEEEEDKVPPKGDMPPELYDVFGEDTLLRIKSVPLNSTDEPFRQFSPILGITLEELDIPPNARTLTRENLIKFVKETSNPIGVINLTDEVEDGKEVQFVRPDIGTFDKVTIFIIIPAEIGLLIETDGDSTVSINSLPEFIQERWKSAGLIHIKKKKSTYPIKEEPYAPAVPIIIGKNPPVPLQKRKKPLIMEQTTAVHQPLVEAPIRVLPIIDDKKPTRKKPPVMGMKDESIAPLPLPVAPSSSSTQVIRKKPPVKSIAQELPVKLSTINESSGGNRNYTRKLIRKKGN
jgi:hypothetical protein